MKKFWPVLSGCLLAVILVALYSAPAEATVLIRHKELREQNLSAFIPRVSGGPDKTAEDEVNARLNEIVQDSVKVFKKNIADADLPAEDKGRVCFYSGYSVKYNKYNLLSISVAGYNYTGGAHGISWKASLTADLKSGKFYTLPELFHPLSNYKNVLNGHINKQIKERSRDNIINFPGVDEKTRFYITEEILVIYYQPYEIAPYVIGIPEFYIPIMDIESMFADTFAVKAI